MVQRRAGHEVRGFPALVDEGTTVGLGIFGSADEADARHRLGVRRLLLIGAPSTDPLAGLDNAAKLGLAGSPYPTVAELLDDCRAAVAGAVVDAHPPVRDEAAFRCWPTSSAATYDERLSLSARRRAPRPRRVAAGGEAAERAGRAAHAGRDAGHARPARAAGAPRLRRRGRARPAAPLPGLPRRRRAPARAARRAGRARPAADGPGRRRCRTPTSTRSPRCPRDVRPERRCAGSAGCWRSTASRSGPSTSARRTPSATSASARL